MLAKLHAQDLRANDRLETSRPAHVRPRPERHDTVIEIETDYYETGTKVVSWPHWCRDLYIRTITFPVVTMYSCRPLSLYAIRYETRKPSWRSETRAT